MGTPVRSRVVDQGPPPSWLLVFDVGDDVVETLVAFAGERRLDGGHFTAIGALERATLAYWDAVTKEYRHMDVPGQVEVCSLIGNIARIGDGGRRVHAHAVLGLADGSTRGGHLLAGRVRPTLEMILRETSEPFERRQDPASGLALLE